MASTDETKAHNDRLLALGPLDPVAYPFKEIPGPSSDTAKCKLSLIRTGIAAVPISILLHDAQPGSTVPAPVFAFLIEKEHDGKIDRVLFDLGIREVRVSSAGLFSFTYLSHQQRSKFRNTQYAAIAEAWNFQTNAGLAEVLRANGVPLESLSGIALSHSHFDHFGDLSEFPKSASLLVGPGSPMGDQLAQEMDVPPEVIREREVQQLNRETDKWEAVGTFRGYDYFGDGSFWLLDAPGVRLSVSILLLTCTLINSIISTSRDTL